MMAMKEVKTDTAPIRTDCKNTRSDQVEIIDNLVKPKQDKTDNYICTDIIPMFL